MLTSGAVLSTAQKNEALLAIAVLASLKVINAVTHYLLT